VLVVFKNIQILFAQKKDKIMKQTAFCGRWGEGKHYVACLKNAVTVFIDVRPL